VQESPQEIANKISEMTREIEELKVELDKKEQLLEELRQERGEYASLGPLKAHITDLHYQLEEKTREVLQRSQEAQQLSRR
jgi:chromosome segregation ATPase